MHPCERIYKIGANGLKYGDTPGICRITGKEAIGLPFRKWVRKTFTDHASLKPGNIISNEALFCFDEKSEIIQKKTGRDKLQRFRTYSHIIYKNKWYIKTKADKKEIYNLIIAGADLVCLTDSGQKHILFKHKPGMWQLDESFIMPNISAFKELHTDMCNLLNLDFSQKEIITGNYLQYRIQKCGLQVWRDAESKIRKQRGNQIFNLAAWLLFKNE